MTTRPRRPKAGARNALADQRRLDAAHDALVEAGATCPGEPADGDAAKQLRRSLDQVRTKGKPGAILSPVRAVEADIRLGNGELDEQVAAFERNLKRGAAYRPDAAQRDWLKIEATIRKLARAGVRAERLGIRIDERWLRKVGVQVDRLGAVTPAPVDVDARLAAIDAKLRADGFDPALVFGPRHGTPERAYDPRTQSMVDFDPKAVQRG